MIVEVTELAGPCDGVLSVTMFDVPPVVGSSAVNVTVMSLIASPQYELEHSAHAQILLSGPDAVVRGVVTPGTRSVDVTTFTFTEFDFQLPSLTLAVIDVVPVAIPETPNCGDVV